jgi:methylated-DNA-[protein]-cysteine S-methyltransferase
MPSHDNLEEEPAVETSLRHTVVDSPIGPLTLVARGSMLSCIFMSDHRHLPEPERFGRAVEATDADDVLRVTADQLEEYFAGERTEFDVALDTEAGTEFQRKVWAALRDIPYGTTISYAELARRIDKPTAFRAVGLANGRNPISIIVPCHRVVGSGGSLTGYGGGLDRKRLLLDLENKATGGAAAVQLAVISC